MNEFSGLQKLIKMLVPETTFFAMEAESKLWTVKCSNCSHERSIWSMGGIRYKAAGNPRIYRVCANCSQRSWHMVYKKQ